MSHSLLLRASSDVSHLDVDMTIVDANLDSGDGGVPHGTLFRRFAVSSVEALDRSDPQLVRARETLRDECGDRAVGDAAGVADHFNAINRVADATGTELDELQRRLAPDMLGALDLARLEND